jgi:hypothetical protein
MNGALVVGICGVVLASLSLGWQAATYVLTGGRITVGLRVGGLGNGGIATAAPETLSQDWLENLASQGFPQPIVAVTVANIGRQPVTVARWGLKSGLGMSLYPAADSIGPDLPHRLDIGESATWAVDMHAVQAFIDATNETFGESQREPKQAGSPVGKIQTEMNKLPHGKAIAGIVELADGRSKLSSSVIR